LLPGCVRTSAPCGQTPVLRVPLTRAHLATIGAVTADGRLLQQTRDRPLRSPDVVGFLRHLLIHLPGTLLVIWDGAPIHRAQPIKALLAAGAARRLRREPLPGDAPDLNPLDQGVWHARKHVELATVCCTNDQHLRQELRQAMGRLRQKPHIIQSAIRHAGYEL
jgi:transposase